MKRKPPGHLPTLLCPPLFLLQMLYRPLAFLVDASRKHDVVRLGWLGAPYYLVTEPELVRQMLADPKRFQKGFMFQKLQMVLGKGLVTLDGKEWIDARRRVQQAFSRGRLGDQQQIVIRHTQDMLDRLRVDAQRGPVDLDAITTELMLRVALELLFGAAPDLIDLEETRRAVNVCNEYARYRMWSLVPEAWNTPRKRRFAEALATLEAIVGRVIDQRRAEARTLRNERCDVLSLLFEAGFDGVELRDHVMTMFIAGHETTAGSVAFLLGLLARHGNVQDRLHDEASGLPAGAVPLDSVPWTEAVWKETLRLYPSVPMLDRMVTQDVQLGDYTVPAGANLIWSPYVMHRKYFVDAETFDPGRFLVGTKPASGCFIPFGEGPRACIGKPLADMEGVTIAAMFARDFRIEPADGADLTVRPMITLRPKNGFVARLTPREPAVLRNTECGAGDAGLETARDNCSGAVAVI
jgi:cytochrome P450